MDDHLQQVLARENSNFLTPKRVIELKKKLRTANFILKPKNLDPILIYSRVPQIYELIKWKCNFKNLKNNVIKKWYQNTLDPEANFLANVLTSSEKWRLTLKSRNKQLSPLHCKTRSFAWQFLNQRIQKKGNWKCTFCGKNDIHAERQFSHSMGCEDLKDKVSRYIQIFGDIENYTNFTAVSLLLGKRIEDQKYAFDEFHIYVFITFYSVWVYSRMISDPIEQEHAITDFYQRQVKFWKMNLER
eukprot:Awhi_evm1s5820